jgi:hypothetical protein
LELGKNLYPDPLHFKTAEHPVFPMGQARPVLLEPSPA